MPDTFIRHKWKYRYHCIVDWVPGQSLFQKTNVVSFGFSCHVFLELRVLFWCRISTTFCSVVDDTLPQFLDDAWSSVRLLLRSCLSDLFRCARMSPVVRRHSRAERAAISFLCDDDNDIEAFPVPMQKIAESLCENVLFPASVEPSIPAQSNSLVPFDPFDSATSLLWYSVDESILFGKAADVRTSVLQVILSQDVRAAIVARLNSEHEDEKSVEKPWTDESEANGDAIYWMVYGFLFSSYSDSFEDWISAFFGPLANLVCSIQFPEPELPIADILQSSLHMAEFLRYQRVMGPWSAARLRPQALRRLRDVRASRESACLFAVPAVSTQLLMPDLERRSSSFV
ncbi:hypothetical protein C8R43DRAFT_1180133 [Mycena crocata]|nr:hypothetical protein C8R43DRAFT_1180133 [Mycena crocata]